MCTGVWLIPGCSLSSCPTDGCAPPPCPEQVQQRCAEAWTLPRVDTQVPSGLNWGPDPTAESRGVARHQPAPAHGTASEPECRQQGHS